MKRTLFLTMLLLVSAGCQHSIEGVWRLDSAYYPSINARYPDQIKGFETKMIFKGHFNFVGLLFLDTTRVAEYGTGTYTINKNRYVENVVYHFYKPDIGKDVRILVEIKKDTLVQRFPVDEEWNLSKDYNTEKYVRLK